MPRYSFNTFPYLDIFNTYLIWLFIVNCHGYCCLEEGMIVWSDWVEMFTEQRNQEEIAGLVLTPE